jgi:hypothetical protein
MVTGVAAGASEPALSGDRPKRLLSEDALGYGGFARALATSILRMVPRDGFVMAVHGPWGSGKTSAVNMAVDALEQMREGAEERVVVVRFNPWWFSGQEDLTRAFFSEVSASLDRRVSTRVVEGLRAVARRAAGAGKLIGAGVALVPGGAALGGLAEAAAAGVGGLVPEARSLDAIRGELEAALREDGKRILVIIDDVDRLPDDEAVQIFRVVKSVADLPNVVHLLVFDRDVARRATGTGATADGPEWLEKIVQASFDLPVPHRVDLHRSFWAKLAEVVGPEPDLQPSRWPDVFHRAVAPWLRTPRDVARLANAVAVAWPVVGDKVDLADFVAVEVLRLFEAGVYDLVRRSAPDLAGLGGDRDDQAALAQRLLDASGEPRRADVRRALQLLFPRLERTWSNRSYGEGFMEGWDRARRICSARRFTSYFTFTLDDDLLSAAERDDVRRAVGDPDAFAALVEALAGQTRRSGGTRADLVLGDLAHDDGILTDDLREAATRSLLAVGDRFIPAIEPASFGAIPTVWRVGHAVRSLLGGLAPGVRVDLLASSMAISPSLRTLSNLIVALSSQHGTEDGEPAASVDERLLDAEGLARVGGAFRVRMAREADRGGIGVMRDLVSVLGAWRRVTDDDEVRAWVSGRLLTRDGLLELAAGLTRTGVGGALGSHAQLEFPTVDRGFVEGLLDVDDFVMRLRALRDDASGPEATVIDRFLLGLRDGVRPSG